MLTLQQKKRISIGEFYSYLSPCFLDDLQCEE